MSDSRCLPSACSFSAFASAAAAAFSRAAKPESRSASSASSLRISLLAVIQVGAGRVDVQLLLLEHLLNLLGAVLAVLDLGLAGLDRALLGVRGLARLRDGVGQPLLELGDRLLQLGHAAPLGTAAAALSRVGRERRLASLELALQLLQGGLAGER